MKMRFLIVVLMFSVCAAPLFGKSEGTVMLYYFQNLTGDESYDDLMYRIPLCLYGELNGGGKKKDISIIDERGLGEYYEDRSINLWDKDFLLTVAKKKRIGRIFFGYYYIESGKISVRGKIYYLESGLILDVSRENSAEDVSDEQDVFLTALTKIESMPLEQMRRCASDEKPKEVKTSRRSLGSIKISKAQTVLATTIGMLIPALDWGKLYSPGVYGDVSYIYYPAKDIVSVGFGLQTGFMILSREDDSYVSSQNVILPFGTSVRYAIPGRGIIDRLILSFNIGLARSSLSINNEVFTSMDLYTSGGISFNFNFRKDNNISVKLGLLTVSYRDSPLNAITGEIGMRFYEY